MYNRVLRIQDHRGVHQNLVYIHRIQYGRERRDKHAHYLHETLKMRRPQVIARFIYMLTYICIIFVRASCTDLIDCVIDLLAIHFF